MRATRALLAIACCVGSTPFAFAEGVEVCTPEQVAEWTQLREDSLGAQLRDASPYLMPEALPPAPDQALESACPGVVDLSLHQNGRADDGIHQWVYALSCKQTVCGPPVSFESNRGAFFLSGEFDLNNNILVSPELQGQLGRYECFRRREGPEAPLLAPQYPHLCFPQTREIHAEISPPSGMRKSLGDLWYLVYPERWQAWRDRLAEGRVCLQGPVVGDTGHALKLEVHPAQFIWWNENKGRKPKSDAFTLDPFKPDGPFVLLAMQDASARYSRKHHFVLNDPLPPKGVWRPWAAGPIEASYEIAVAATPEETLHLTIEKEELDRPLHPADRALPALVSYLEARDAGGEKGKFRAIVSNAADPQQVQAEVRVLCRTVPDTEGPVHYLAKLAVHLTVGSDLDWHEGFLALRVTDRRLPRSPSLEVNEAGLQKATPAVLSLLTWKPTNGTGWSSVAAVSPQDAATAHEITRKLFEAADWTGRLGEHSHPYPGLRRLTQIDVQVQHSLRGPTEHKAKARDMRSRLEWPEKPVLKPLSGVSCGDMDPPTLPIDKGLRITLPNAALAPCRLDIATRVSPSPGFIKWASDEKLTAPAESTETWSVWTHGFLAGREDQWTAAVEAFWNEEMDRCSDDGHIWTRAAMRAPSAEPPCPDAVRTLDRSLPKEEVRILLPPILRDGVVSVNELAALADDLREMADTRCRQTCPKRPPSTWVEAK